MVDCSIIKLSRAMTLAHHSRLYLLSLSDFSSGKDNTAATHSSQEDSAQDEAVYLHLISPSSSTISLSSSSSRGRQDDNLQLFDSLQSAVQTVTLQRISPLFLEADSIQPPFTFNVDSTVTKLTIFVNGSKPLDTTICDPTGTVLNNRVRRSIADPPDQPSSRLIEEQRTQNNDIATTDPKELPRSNIATSVQEIQNTPQNQQHGDNRIRSRRTPNSTNHDRNKNKTQYQITNQQRKESNLKQHPQLSENQNHLNNSDTHSYKIELSSSDGIRHSAFENGDNQEISENSFHKFLSSYNDKNKYSEKSSILSLGNNSLFSRQTVRHLEYNGSILWQYMRMNTSRDNGYAEPRHHESSSSGFKALGLNVHRNSSLSQVSRLGSRLQVVDRLSSHSPVFDRQGSHLKVADRLGSRSQVIDRLGSHSEFVDTLGSHSQVDRQGSRSQVVDRPGLHSQVNRMGSQRTDYSNHAPNNHTRTRRRRTATLMSMQVFEDVAVWEIEPPQAGTWSIIVNGPEPTQVLVTAQSILDFRYEFLDLRTMAGITTPPVAYDTTLVRLSLTCLACIQKVEVLNLVDDTGETIAAIAIDNIGTSQGQVNDDGRNNILVWFQTPGVPFYVAITGYDYQGAIFQRLSQARVVPRTFALSVQDAGTDPLVPGADYRYVLHLRNKGQADMFKIEGTWDKHDYFRVSVMPGYLRVGQSQTSHATLIVGVQPSIYTIMRGVLTVTTTRVSDSVTESLTLNVTAEPASFLQDHTPPTCTITSRNGGCRPNIPCIFQKWAVSVSVSDSSTGVRSAVFLNPPHGAYTNIQFSYLMRNRTTRADYGYNCCNVEIILLAYDLAGNPSRCNLHASMLGPATTALSSSSPSSSLSSSASSHNTTQTVPSSSAARTSNLTSSTTLNLRDRITITSAPTNLINISSSTTSNDPKSSKITSSITTPSWQLVPNETSYHSQGPNQTFSCFSSSAWGTNLSEPMSGVTVLSTGMLINSSRDNGTALLNSSDFGQQKFDPSKHETLRLAAIICGSIGGTAALAIVVLCVIYRYVHNQRRRSGPRRQGSNGSDITMGGSSESRYEGGSENNSFRMSKFADKESEIWDSEATCYSPDRARSEGRENIAIYDKEQRQYYILNQKVLNKYEARLHQKARGRFNPKSQTGEAKDVVFSYVVVNVDDEKDGRVSNEKDGRVSNEKDGRVSNEKDGRVSNEKDERASNEKDGRASNEISVASLGKASYSPVLKSAGRMFSSMVDVQKQMEEMDKQRESLSLAVNGGSTSPRIHARGENSRGLIDDDSKSLEIASSYRDTPPGSPQMVECNDEKGERCIQSDAIEVGQEIMESVRPRSGWANANSPAAIESDRKFAAERHSESLEKFMSRLGHSDRSEKSLSSMGHSDKSIKSVSSSASLDGAASLQEMDNVTIAHSKKTNSSSQRQKDQIKIHNFGEQIFPDNPSGLNKHKSLNLNYRQERNTSPERFSESAKTPTVPVRNRTKRHLTVKKLSGSDEIFASSIDDKAESQSKTHYHGPRDNQDAGDDNNDEDTAEHPPRPLRQRLDVQQTRMPVVITDANQMALRLNIEHIRRKLLNFQRRIDNEIDEGVRRSRDHSPSSSGNYSNSEDD